MRRRRGGDGESRRRFQGDDPVTLTVRQCRRCSLIYGFVEETFRGEYAGFVNDPKGDILRARSAVCPVCMSLSFVRLQDAEIC